MKHTLEEIGEFADEHTETGGFFIWKRRKVDRGDVGEYGCQIGGGRDHFGETPNKAVDSAIETIERGKNGNHLVTFNDADLVKTEDDYDPLDKRLASRQPITQDRAEYEAVYGERLFPYQPPQFNPPLVDRRG